VNANFAWERRRMVDPSPNWLDVNRWKIDVYNHVAPEEGFTEDLLDDLIREIWNNGYNAGYDQAEADEEYCCEGH
jgi:hypothetical protein